MRPHFFERFDIGISARRHVFLAILGFTGTINGSAQTDPWSNAATKMGGAFSGPIAKGFALVAIVIGGLQLAFGDGSSGRTVGGIVFGLGLALGAASFMSIFFS